MSQSEPMPTDKAAVRRRLLAARRAMTPEQLEAAGAMIMRGLLGLPEVVAARCVAAYVDFGTEPATGPLLTTLADRGVGVLLPVLRADADLDWARFAGPASLVAEPAGSSLLAPAGARLGLDALAAADVVVVPALSVDRVGVRLGRGGGSYDRALRRARPDAAIVAAVYDGELVDRLPRDTHDVPVSVVVTPSGVYRVGASR